VAIGAAILLALAAHRGLLHALRDHPWPAIAVVGILDIAVPFTALSIGEQYVTSSLAGILIATTPLFVGALAVAFLPSERPSKKPWAGLALGFAGVVVLVAAASYAAASLLVRARLGGVDSLSAGAFALAIAAIALAPGALLESPGHADAGAWAAIGALGLLCTAGAFALYYELIAQAGATRAALTTYFSPLVSVPIGALLLGDAILASAILGLALILAGSWLAR
jgi:drug/metabolite transporter (DMT)-like permease